MSIPCFLLLMWGIFSVVHGRIRKRASDGNSRKSHLFKRSDSFKCTGSFFRDNRVNRCCKKCPAGNFVKKSCDAEKQDPVCEHCALETYLELPNYLYECRKCRHCDADTEYIMKTCNDTSDSICACKKGTYRDQKGQCHLCKECKDRQITTNCSQNEDATCGSCLPGFYENGNVCLPCPISDQNICWNLTYPECLMTCKSNNPVQDSSMTYLASGALLLLLLPIGVFLIHRHKRKRKESLGKHEVILKEQEKIPNLNGNCPDSSFFLQAIADRQNSSNPSQGQPVSVFQKGSTLYDIIDSVPVRRWKEFMRTLELPDKEIELVQVEISSFRDQQYEMLRRWGHLRMAGLDAIYNALERMNLSGCAEELRQKLDGCI